MLRRVVGVLALSAGLCSADVWDTSTATGVQLGSGTWSTSQSKWVTYSTSATSLHVWSNTLNYAADFNRKVSGSSTISSSNGSSYTVTLGSNITATSLRYGNDCDWRLTINPDAGNLYAITLTGAFDNNNTTVGDGGGTITVNAPIALGSGAGSFSTAASSKTSTFAGRISGSSAAVQINPSGGTGTINFAAANVYSGSTTVYGGTLRISHPQALGGSSLTISGGSAVVADGLTAPLALSGLSINGTLNVADNDLIVHNGDAAAITAKVAAGRVDAYSPAWNGSGIISSAARSFFDENFVDLVSVGVVKNQDFEDQVFLPMLESFGGVAVSASDVLVKYTYMGDADLSGEVDGSDYQLIDTGYNFGLSPMWVTGDFNYDNAIDGSDYQLIDTAYGLQLFGTLGHASTVPEPSGALLLALAGLTLRRYRTVRP